MRIKAGRIAVAVLAAEIIGVFVLVVVVMVFGPKDGAEARTYAESLGLWVGPICGFTLCLAGAWWVAKPLSRAHVANGFVLGVAAATLDVLLLVVAGTPFKAVYAISNVGRVVAGTLGGWLALRRHRETAITT
jgi:hypothetical protein